MAPGNEGGCFNLDETSPFSVTTLPYYGSHTGSTPRRPFLVMTMPKGSKRNRALLAVLTRSHCLKKAMMAEFTTLRCYPYNLQGVDYNGVDTPLGFLIFMMQYGDTLLSRKQAYEHFSHRHKFKPPSYWRRKATNDWYNSPEEKFVAKMHLSCLRTATKMDDEPSVCHSSTPDHERGIFGDRF